MFGRFKVILFAILASALMVSTDSIYEQKGYYLFPIRPGEVNYLSGSMGELRSTHFHAGIDIKTGGVQGYTVYAAADGWVNRVKISTGGYGKALYLQHPNGTFTVYAHLRDFSKDVADYVRSQQYKKESYEVDLFPAKGQFSFYKGDIIAESGNTGSSSAPHLHFEIRDANHHVLDPLRFDFPEIIDSKVPEVRAVAFKTMDIESEVNGQFGRYDFNTTRDENVFNLREPVSLKGRIGVEIYAFDRQNETSNRYGLPCVEFYHNEELVYSHHIKTFAFRDTRNLLVHTNYPHMRNTRRRFHKLYIDDGNEIDFYTSEGTGIVNINDTSVHNFSIKLWDVNGNTSVTNFQAKLNEEADHISPTWRRKTNYRVTDNVLEIYQNIDQANQEHISLYANRMAYEIEPSFQSKSRSYYLWDLRDGLPDSIDFCGKVEQLNFKTFVPSGNEFNYFSDRVDLEFYSRTLFDTLYLQTWHEIDTIEQREIFKFDHKTFPFRGNVKVTFKPTLTYDSLNQTGVYAINSKGQLSYFGGEWKENEVTIYTRDLVDFTLAVDSLAPSIKPIKVNRDELKFIIEDDMSGIASFEARVDGRWVLMNYESKRNLVWSEKLDANIPFSGELLFQVKDNAGNTAVFNSNL